MYMSAYALVHACISMSAILLVCTPVCLHGMSACLHCCVSMPASLCLIPKSCHDRQLQLREKMMDMITWEKNGLRG